MDVLDRALLEEDVRLVEQQHAAPRHADVENLLQLRLERARVCAQLTCRDHV